MKKNQPNTSKSAALILGKSKSLLDITNKILEDSSKDLAKAKVSQEFAIHDGITIIGDLMWEKETCKEKMYLNEAMEYAKYRSLGGYDDWRLPTIEELKHIVTLCGGDLTSNLDDDRDDRVNRNMENESYQDSYSKKGFFSSDCYLSSTHDGDTDKVCVLCFEASEYGCINSMHQFYVRCVRKKDDQELPDGKNKEIVQDTPSQELVTYDDDITIIGDLLWEKESREMNFVEAMEYAKNLTLGGYDDWRLPTMEELGYIVILCGGEFTANTSSGRSLADVRNMANGSYRDRYKEKGFVCDFYWSPTRMMLDYVDCVYGVDFYYGKKKYYFADDSHGVRCVRDAPALVDKNWVERLLAWSIANDIDEQRLPREKENLINLTKFEYALAGQLKKLPREIGNLVNLKKLVVARSKITKLPQEIGDLVNLVELDLGDNQLTELPREIGNLVNLEWFSLEDNQLTELPKEIGNLVNLMTLDLSGNQFTELPKEIGNLVNLTELYLGDNQLTEEAKEMIRKLNIEKVRF